MARIAAGAIDATALAPLAVQTTQINNLAVTNAKLAESAVTRNKIEWPLIQPTNDMAGGFRMRESVGTYAVGFYMAGNGLAAFGAGTTTTIPTNLVLGQQGQVSVGALQGAAKFNVFASTSGLTTGARIYASGGTWMEWYHDSFSRPVLAANSVNFLHFHPTNGYMTMGPTATDAARLHLTQASDSAAEGILLTIGSAVCQIYAVTEGSLYLGAGGRYAQMDFTNAALSPSINNALSLGSASKRWSTLYATASNFAGTATFSAGVVMAGALSVNAITLTGGHILPSVNDANTVGNTSNRFQGAAIGGAVIDNNGIFPRTTGVHVLGSTSNVWFQVYANEAYKTGGGSWSVISDDKTKMKTKFRPYREGLEAVLQLKPTWFTYNGDYGTPRGEEYAGFRAEELKAVAPEMVRTIKAAKTPEESEDEVATVNTSNVELMLVNAIKELATRITALEDSKAG